MNPSEALQGFLPFFPQRPGPFYEVWYAILADPETKESLWVRFALLRTKKDSSRLVPRLYFAFVAGRASHNNIAFIQTFAQDAFCLEENPLALRIGDMVLTLDGLKGSLKTPQGLLTLNLAFEPKVLNHGYLPLALVRALKSRSRVFAPYPALSASGDITLYGSKRRFSHALGHLAHHFGIRQIYGWDWLHAPGFEGSPGTLLEILVPVLGARLPQLGFIRLYHEGAWILKGGLGRALFAGARRGLGCWHFHGAGVKVEVRAPLESLVVFPYEAPQGGFSYCINSQQADCLVECKVKGGRLRLFSKGLAAVETHRPEGVKVPLHAYAFIEERYKELKNTMCAT